MPATPEDKHRELLRLDVAGWRALLDKLEGVFGSKKCDIAATEHRAITLEHLRTLLRFAQEHCQDWRDTRTWSPVEPCTVNLYQLADWCIRPATVRSKCSMAELFVTTTSPPSWYLSHWWGEPLQDFYACVEVHTKIRQLPPTATYWVCAHANRQWELNEELTKDPSQSSFYKAMVESQGILLLLDKDGTPFKRIWCAYEAYVGLVRSERDQGQGRLLFDIATSKDSRAFLVTDGPTAAEDSCSILTMAGFQEAIAAHGGDPQKQLPEEALAAAEKQCIGGHFKTLREMAFPDEVMQLGFSVEVEKAAATSEDDRRHILNKIAGRSAEALDEPIVEACEAYKAVGHRIGGLMARTMWVKAAAARKTRSLGLAAPLAADQERQELTFDFTSVRKAELFSADLLEDLGQGLHRKLKSLKATLNFCDGSGPQSPEFLEASKDPARRQRAHALRCFLRFAPELEELSLDFFWWFGLAGDVELAALGLAVMELTKLRRLSLTFASKCITERGLAALFEGLRHLTLEELSLCFNDLRELGKGAVALGHTLCGLSGLQKLSLGFNNSAFDHDGVAAMLAGVSGVRQLEELHLSFNRCYVYAKSPEDASAPLTGSVLAQKEDLRLRLQELLAPVVQAKEGESSFTRGEAALAGFDPTFSQKCLQSLISDEKEELPLGLGAGAPPPVGFTAYWYYPRGPWASCLGLALSQCQTLSEFTLCAMFSELEDSGLRLLGRAAAELEQLSALTLVFAGATNITEMERKRFFLEVGKLQRLTKVELGFQGGKSARDLTIWRVEDFRETVKGLKKIMKDEGVSLEERAA